MLEDDDDEDEAEEEKEKEEETPPPPLSPKPGRPFPPPRAEAAVAGDEEVTGFAAGWAGFAAADPNPTIFPLAFLPADEEDGGGALDVALAASEGSGIWGAATFLGAAAALLLEALLLEEADELVGSFFAALDAVEATTLEAATALLLEE